MKVFVIVNNYLQAHPSQTTGWYIVADSAVSNTGKPFYLPENLGKTVVSLSAAVKISRLGKAVSPKFAQRYYSDYAPALHFHLPDYASSLLKAGLPADPSRSFDKSLIVGEFLSNEGPECLEMWVNGQKKAEFSFDNLIYPINEIISEISVLNTIKMGDILIPGLSEEISLNEGDLIEVKNGGATSFHVKVK